MGKDEAGTDAILMTRSSCCAEEAGLEQVELAAPIHLAFDELQLGDLTFGLAIGQRGRDRRADCALSLMTPLANCATKLVRARSSQGSSSTSDFPLTMAWNANDALSEESLRGSDAISVEELAGMRSA
jgi:hypothetical protein